MFKRAKYTTSLLLFIFIFITILPTNVFAAGTINTPKTTIAASIGSGISASVTSDGDVYTWGHQRGNMPYKESYLTPTYQMSNATDVSSGCLYVLAKKSDGTLFGWGVGVIIAMGGGLFVYPPVTSDTPTFITDNVMSFSAGFSHYAVIKTDRSLWIKGLIFNSNNTYTQFSTLTKIMDNVNSVSAGQDFTMAIKTDGSLWGWGKNNYGQLGDKTTVDKSSPVKIMDGVASVSSGSDFTMAIKTDGSLWAWGRNDYGQLGNRSTKMSNVPVKILDGVQSIDLGNYHAGAIKTDGSLWTWGYNALGQLGDGTTREKHTPTKVMDGVARVTAGGLSTMVIKQDGSLWAWGDNYEGQLGDGTKIDKISPVLISYPDAHHWCLAYDPDTRTYSLVLEPIDAASGAMIINKDLISLTGARQLDFKITYNSLLLNKGSLGNGWDHNYETRLELQQDDSLRLYFHNNRINDFHLVDVNTYKSRDQACRLDTIVKNTDGSYTLTRNDQSTYKFDSAGKMTSQADKNGHKLNLGYDASGHLSSITEPISGRELQLSYNANGLLSSVSDALNRQHTFQYDTSNNLLSLTDPSGGTTEFTYDQKGQVLTETDPEGIMVFSNTYDDQGRVVTQDDGISTNQLSTLSYDETQPGKIITTIKDRLGNQKIMVHNSRYQLIEEIDELGNTTRFTYDENGNRTSITDTQTNTTAMAYDARNNVISVTDPAGRITTITYDNKNNLLTVRNANGNTQTYTYDANNLLTVSTDPLNNSTRHQYDSNGLLLSTSLPRGGINSYTYNNGMPVTVTDTLGNTTTNTYDEVGRLTGITNPLGKTTNITYDERNNLLSTTDPLRNTNQYTYDGNDKILSKTDPNGNTTTYTYDADLNLSSITDALGNTTHYQYDGEDHLVKSIDARGNETAYAYDACGHQVSITDPLGNTITYQYDSIGNITEKTDAKGNTIQTITYNSMKKPLTITDGLGNTKNFEYDNLNRLISASDPMGRTTQYNYNALSQLTSSTDPLDGQGKQSFDADGNRSSLTDPNNNRLQFDLDLDDQLIGKSSAAGSVTYAYNQSGLLFKVTNGRGQETTLQYDDAGRLTEKTSQETTTSYTYDNNGNLLTISDDSGTLTRQYDALNRVTQYIDNSGNTIQYAYDEVGNLIEIIYPDGKQVEYTYNAANRLIKVEDWNSRITNYAYDENNRLTETRRPDGSVETRTYNNVGQLISIEDVDQADRTINSYQCSYDAAGNVISETSFNPPAMFTLNNISMTYTEDNRLDTYNGQTVNYDSDGNMTNGPLNGAISSFTYSSYNLLTAVGDSNYLYDAEHKRVGVQANGSETHYTVNPGSALSQVLVKTDNQGNETYYVYGLGLIGEENEGNYRTYHYDLRGSTTALTDAAGTITDTFQYGPYGELVGHTGDTKTPFLFNGRDGVMSDENGLYYMRARYYNPEIKRFINQDILLGDINSNGSLNRYAYCQGNPINFEDPTGLIPDCGESVGDFKNLQGGSLEDILARIPQGTPNTFRPSNKIPDGFKFRWTAKDGVEWEVYGHCPNPTAPKASNDNNGWTFRVIQRATQQPDGSVIEYYLSEDNNWYTNDPKNGLDAYHMNETHIPMQTPNNTSSSDGSVVKGIPIGMKVDDAGNLYNFNGEIVGEYDYEYGSSYVWGSYTPGLPGINAPPGIVPEIAPSIYPAFGY